MDPFDIPSPPIPHAPNPPPVNPPPYPGLRGKKKKNKSGEGIWHFEKVGRGNREVKGIPEHRACFVSVWRGGFKGKGGRKCREDQSPVWKWMTWIHSSVLWQWTAGLTSLSCEQREKWYVCSSLFWGERVPYSLFHIQTAQAAWLSFPQGILNHCFDDIENFMAKLQQTAEAATVLNQRKKKNKKKSKKQSAEGKKEIPLWGICTKDKMAAHGEWSFFPVAICFSTTDDLLTAKAQPPPEEEFISIFQKFKYCFSLLVRIQSGSLCLTWLHLHTV